jgi:hypothetical protein
LTPHIYVISLVTDRLIVWSQLRRYDEALLAVEDLLCLDKENKDAAALKSRCASELAKRSSAASSARRAQEQLETAWKTAW